MKKAVLFAGLAIALIVPQFLVNCADPLDQSKQPSSPIGPGSNTDTIHDTLIVIDTVIRTLTDTVVVLDTVVQPRIDTVIIIDTVIHTNNDTVIVVDTVVQTLTDTLYVADTVTHVDTVTIVVPNDSGKTMCARIEGCQGEIEWILHNEAGTYTLFFAASTERDHPTQTLNVDIDGHTYQWNTSESTEFQVTRELGHDARIRITAAKPPARGHAITVCLTVSP